MKTSGYPQRVQTHLQKAWVECFLACKRIKKTFHARYSSVGKGPNKCAGCHLQPLVFIRSFSSSLFYMKLYSLDLLDSCLRIQRFKSRRGSLPSLRGLFDWELRASLPFRESQLYSGFISKHINKEVNYCEHRIK